MNIPYIKEFFGTGLQLSEDIKNVLQQEQSLYLITYCNQLGKLQNLTLESDLEKISTDLAKNLFANNKSQPATTLAPLILKKLKLAFSKRERRSHLDWKKLDSDINNILFKISAKDNNAWPGEKLEIKNNLAVFPACFYLYVCQPILSINEITAILRVHWYSDQQP